MTRRSVRRLGRRVLQAIAAGIPHFPVAGLFLVDAIAALSFPLIRRRSLLELPEPFERLTPAETRAALKREWAYKLRNLMLYHSVQRSGLKALAAVTGEQSLDHVPAPAIMATFHTGPIAAFASVLRNTRTHVLVFRRTRREQRHPSRHPFAETGETEDQRALALHQGARHLRDGGSVFMVFDPATASRIGAPFFGRSLQLARGPFVLARLSRAPIVPVITRWRGYSVEVITGQPILHPDEDVMAAMVAGWLETYYTENPTEISERTLDLQK
jgi:lauroyl/myristoyl acyltransferase